MRVRRHPPPGRNVDDLEHLHRTDVEAVSVQLRAVGRAIEAVTAAIEEFGASLPDGVPPAVITHLEAARWELKDL